MRKPEELTREQLMDVVEAVQSLLYLDMSGPDRECLTEEEKEAGIAPSSDYWNPRKEWTPDCLDAIAAKLEEHGLVPAEPRDSLPKVACQLCGQPADARTAHRHGAGWVGDECCWDERLRASE